MKLAIISDIHGNYYALKQVIEDAEKNEVESFIFAGDYIFDLPFPNEVAEELMRMKNAYFVAGNKERYLDILGAQNESKWIHKQVGAIYQTFRELKKDVFEFLTSLKDECYITLDSGRKIYVTHYFENFPKQSKIRCSSSGFHKKMLQTPFTHQEFLKEFNAMINQEKYREAIDETDASVVIFGHDHLQAYGYCGSKLVIDPGSCGQPLDFNTYAAYTILEETADGFTVFEKRVEYDIEAVIGAAKRTRIYAEGAIWSELVFLALRTGRDYFGKMFEIAHEIAASKGENGSFFGNDTWEEAYLRFKSIYNKKALMR